MKKVLCVLVCLGMASITSALSITNGDFENQTGGYVANVVDWYDYGGPTVGYLKGPFFWGNGTNTINPTKLICMGDSANTNEDGGNHAYIYQSIGVHGSYPMMVEVELQWGLATNRVSGEEGLTVMILESDGTFEPNEWDGPHDIYGGIGITEIDRASVIRNVVHGPSGAMYQKFILDLSSATVGRELFLRINDFRRVGLGVWGVQVDNITIIPASVANQAPEDGATYIPVWRTSPENDLVFSVVDAAVGKVDVLFGPENDPNLSLKPAYKIVNGMSVSQGQNTVTLETQLAADLEYSTKYYWKVLAREPNGVLKYTSPVRSFTTIQEGPYLGDVTPNIQAVLPGEDAVFSLSFAMKADTYQWYKEGVAGALTNGDDYAGVDSNSLTVLNVQLEDVGYYYCVGTEIATGLTAQSISSGGLSLKKLVTHYPFETTYTVGSNILTPDIISGKDAQLMGGASVNAADENSIVGGYLSLNNPLGATTQYANIADTSVAHHQDITISCWVRPADLDYQWARVFDFGRNDTDYFFLTMNYGQNYSADIAHGEPIIYDGLDVARCEFRHAGNNPEIDGFSEINADEWIFVAVTVEDGLGKIYLNGQYAGEENVPSPAEIIKTYNYIGKGIGFDPPNFNGLIDELKIYNYAQTKEQIAQDYLAVTGVDWICDMETYDLVAWDFDRNCRVDFDDFVVIAAQWLNDFRIYAD